VKAADHTGLYPRLTAREDTPDRKPLALLHVTQSFGRMPLHVTPVGDES
jgi:hypothetical protein